MEICLKVKGVGVYTYVETIDARAGTRTFAPSVTDIVALLRRMFRSDPPPDAETAVAHLVHALVGAHHCTRVDVLPRLHPAARIDIEWRPHGDLMFRYS